MAEKPICHEKTLQKYFLLFFETILECLEKEESVQLMNFGSLYRKDLQTTKGYNPSSKIVVQLPKEKAIRFKLAKRAAFKS